MYLFLLDEHAKLRKIAGIIKANTFGGEEGCRFSYLIIMLKECIK